MKVESLVVLLEDKYGLFRGCVGKIIAVREGIPMVKFDEGYTYVDFDILEEIKVDKVV